MSDSLSSNGSLNRLFNPRAIGIIGASSNPSGGGYFVHERKNKNTHVLIQS